MRFLVTGASGFVGANLVREIASKGDLAIAATIDTPSQFALDFLADCDDGVTWVSLDVRDKKQVMDLFRETKVDAIVHAAAITSVSDDYTVGDMLATNVRGTVNILEAVRVFEVPRMIFLSSGAVYGHRAPYPSVVREDDKLGGDGPYAVSKIAAEQFCRIQAKEHGFSAVICRLGTQYGPMEVANPYRSILSIPGRLVNLAERADPIGVFGLSRKRSYCFVGDAARIVHDLASQSKLSTDTFNVGSPNRTALSDLLGIISHLFRDFAYEETRDQNDADISMTADDERPGFDTTILESQLDSVRWTRLEEGIERFMNWKRKSQ
jgi:nucleoside-diphosphate-sugar epimerase